MATKGILAGLPTAPVKTKRQAEEQGRSLENVQKGQSIQEKSETIPYAGPKAKAELTNAQLKTILDVQQNARDERKTFEGLEEVKTYQQGMRYFSAALTVPKGSEGDQDLVTLAAKVQDPTGAVMQGDIDRYNNVQVALDYVPQWMSNQFRKDGKFTPETRQRIIAFLRNRVDTYRPFYEESRNAFVTRIGDLNSQLEPLGVKPVDAQKILPPDPMKVYGSKIEAYDKKLEADKIRQQREEGGPSVGAFEEVPEGAQIAGEDVQGWRLSPESEAEVVMYARSKDATPEGYAKLLADKAIAEGHVLPSQRDDYIQRTTSDVQDFFKQSAEQRAGIKGIDYSEIDKSASENAGLFETVAQAARNLPESGAQLAEGLIAIPKDAMISALTGTRTGTIKTFTDLAMELGRGQLDGPTTTAFANAMKERYGSLDAIQRTGIKDPLGLAGDLSLLLTAGGSAAARLPGALGRAGQVVRSTGRLIDPLSGAAGLVTEAVPAAYRAAEKRVPGAVEGIENAPSNIVGFPSGSGGEAIREAAGAGFERGMEGAPTPRSEAFTEGMRRPGESAENIVYTARDAIKNLREMASQSYRDAMQKFGKSPTPLSMDLVRERMLKIKPRNYDVMVDAKKRPADHIAWEQMNDAVNHYADKAAQDPSLLDPMAVDAFKQDLYDIGSKIGGQFDKGAANIARTAYTAVRQELVKHDPVYADIMKDYEKAAVEARELEDTFSLGQARGRPLKVDTAARKLQSIMRNNAFTNYGMRAKQGERIADLDTTGTFKASTAGQMMSSPTARGITTGFLAGGLPLTAAGAYVNPLTLLATVPAMLATSPRLAGELAYGAGRAAGTGVRAGKTLLEKTEVPRTKLAELYQKYPSLFLAEAQVGSRLEETEAEKLRRKYELDNLTPFDPSEMY